MTEEIAIVRTAAATALGTTLAETVDALERNSSGVRTPVALEQTPGVDSGAGEVPLRGDADRGADRAERLLAQAVHSLLGPDAAATLRTDPSRCSAVFGTTLAGIRHCGAAMRAEARGDEDAALASYAQIPSSAVIAAAMRGVPVGGLVCSISCACASALAALATGCALLRAGDADCVIAGGYDPISEFSYGGFSALQLVARGQLSPFASEREGMKLGEGAALFLLRRLSDAVKLGEAPIAVVVATHETSDAHHLTQPQPEGRGAGEALAAVTRGVLPDLLVAHATGTLGNDSAEYAAYRIAFGDKLSHVPVVALKGRFGHPLGAAGALELAAVLGCADRGFVPSTAGRGRDAVTFPALALLEGQPQRSTPVNIAVLSAGFGGANAAIAVRRGAPSDSRISRASEREDGAALPAEPRSSSRASLYVAGIGAVCAAGRGLDGLRALTLGGPVDEEALAPLLDRARTRRLGMLPRLMLAAVRDLCDCACIDSAALRKTPVLAATWLGAADFTEQYYRDLLKSGIDLANPMLFAESVPNIGSAHISLGYGITAPSASVVGSRTAGFQALQIARARIAAGAWERAIVVAAEETHPIINRVLARCVKESGPVGSAAVAFLLEQSPSDSAHCFEISSVRRPDSKCHAERSITSTAACDRPARNYDDPQGALALPELGAATGLALAAIATHGALPHAARLIRTCDPSDGVMEAITLRR